MGGVLDGRTDGHPPNRNVLVTSFGYGFVLVREDVEDLPLLDLVRPRRVGRTNKLILSVEENAWSEEGRRIFRRLRLGQSNSTRSATVQTAKRLGQNVCNGIGARKTEHLVTKRVENKTEKPIK